MFTSYTLLLSRLIQTFYYYYLLITSPHISCMIWWMCLFVYGASIDIYMHKRRITVKAKSFGLYRTKNYIILRLWCMNCFISCVHCVFKWQHFLCRHWILLFFISILFNDWLIVWLVKLYGDDVRECHSSYSWFILKWSCEFD